MKGQIRQHIILFGITVAIPIVNVVILLLCLNHYKPHQEVELYSIWASLYGIIAGFHIAIIGLFRHAGKGHLALSILSVAVCVAVFLIARSIPFCPMCEGLKPEDLGLLAHWIPCGP